MNIFLFLGTFYWLCLCRYIWYYNFFLFRTLRWLSLGQTGQKLINRIKKHKTRINKKKSLNKITQNKDPPKKLTIQSININLYRQTAINLKSDALLIQHIRNYYKTELFWKYDWLWMLSICYFYYFIIIIFADLRYI